MLIALGVTGGIGAYKAVEVARKVKGVKSVKNDMIVKGQQ